MKHLIFKFLLIFLSTLLAYLIVFFYFYINLEKDFKNNIKNKENLYFYKKFSPIVNHIRYEDNYRFEKKESELIFNFIKNKSDKNIILFQGDSWFQQINEFKGMKNFIKENLSGFSKIINAGTSSYSPSLINAQYNVIEKYFKIKPNVVVIYIDQTDMGDELCRYKNLLNLNDSDELESVSMEEFPLFRDTFNLHEKIYFSEIELQKIKKIFKTQLYINYKMKKSFSKIKKRISLLLNNKSQYKSCDWKMIENYKISMTDDEKSHFTKVIKRLFFQLEKKKFIEKIFVVTHPHKLQLTTQKYPIDVSDIVKMTVKNYKKVEHINFSKILKEDKKFYSDFNTIWLNDNIHLNQENYKKFFNKIIQKVSES